VDVGCGDGGLIRSVAEQADEKNAKFFGVDRSLSRVSLGEREAVQFVRSIDEVPTNGCTLIFSNELFDAFPFARLVQRGEHLHELSVHEHEGALDWSERAAPASYEQYFSSRGIALAEGQFADISLEWELFYEDLARFVDRGLIVTIDYGFAQQKLFHPRIRRFGTAASYKGQRVTRDLLSSPGERDLTAHINFTDLERAGERHGFVTLFFDSLAKFLLGVGVTDHELFRPVHEIVANDAQHGPALSAVEGLELLEARDEARRLILPDGIGEDLRVLVQAREMTSTKWSFERRLF
jgi:SAM-dependent MidA family methyltransferase